MLVLKLTGLTKRKSVKFTKNIFKLNLSKNNTYSEDVNY